MTHELVAQVVASVPPRSFVRGTPSAVEPIPPPLDVAFAEELWRQTVDIWHPELEDCAVPWPDDWPERWDDSEVEDEAAEADPSADAPVADAPPSSSSSSSSCRERTRSNTQA